MIVSEATSAQDWDSFLAQQQFRPFLQSWTMGEVYREIGQEPVRLEIREGNELRGICFGHIVDAKRGKHLSVPYGPITAVSGQRSAVSLLIEELKRIAKEQKCAFLRMSPFWIALKEHSNALAECGAKPSPLHLLAEHLWYVPLQNPDPWDSPLPEGRGAGGEGQTEEDIFKNFRSTTRNLIRRAEKESVTIEASPDPERDLPHFLALHEETRRRHSFTPYTDAFFRAQVKYFVERKECTLYLARYQGDVIATSIHIHAFGETSYHHGASSSAHSKIPASYLLQWTAIKDALKRRDRVYNFWGIAPITEENPKPETRNPKHPFAGVTLFKTGFGGKLLNLVHSHDIPLSKTYYITRAFERLRRWRRGF